jgi:uncharacterized protein (DUF302 family)
MAYHYSKKLNLPFEDVVAKVENALQQQGFTTITTADMSQALSHELEINFRNYKILGAYNPALAYKAISLEPHIGIMLPCNIVIQEHENGTVEVSALNPMETMDENMATTSLESVATEVSNHLRTAIDTLHTQKSKFSFSYN